jgi:O-antigen/teichoic acid export membrane protein
MLSALAAFVTQAGSFALVGSILSEGDLGLARAAERLALMVSFPLTVVNPFIAPRIVYHVTFVDKNSLRILMSKACLASVLPALPVALTLLFIPHTFLSLFGPNFGDAALPLQVFAVAQLFTAATAPFAQLLYVGGNERALAHILIASMLVGMLLFPIATIYFGLFGFAAAYATINVVKAAFIVLYTVQLKAV